MAIRQSSGRLTLLRVHRVGGRFGPPSDSIDVEAVIRLDTEPGQAFGFQMRTDSNRVVHQGMFDLLRDAWTHNHRVTIDYDIDDGKNNGNIIRVWLQR